MTKEEMSVLLDNCIFDGILTQSDFKDKIINRLPILNIKYSHGTTKLVLIPEDADFVIKIPFNGTYSLYFNNKTKKNENVEFLPFKKAFNGDSVYWDYCLAESVMYAFAKTCHVEDFFCNTTLFKTINNYPIYIQNKATPLTELSIPQDESSLQNLNLTTEHRIFVEDYYLNEYWIADACKYYGQEKVNDFLSFIIDMGIRDLFDHNIGYIKDRPVVFDYSSWIHH